MKNVIQRKRIWGMPAVFLSILLCSQPFTAFSQITVTTLAAPVNTLSINDLDFINSTTPKWLFTITMSASGSRPITATMTIRLDVQLAGGSSYLKAAEFISDSFTINGTRTVTNLELGRGHGIPQRVVNGYFFDPQAKTVFQEVALPSGSMPAGSYKFTVNVDANGSSDSKDFTFVLTNPSSPVLLSPSEGETVTEQFPLFEWQYDGPRATIAVFEMLPEQRSLEEAATGTPHATATVSTRSFRYPISGARSLQPGRTYVWYVNGLIGAAGGTNLELRSDLRSFTVSTTPRSSMAWILEELESALPPTYKPVFDQIRSQNLSPSGTFRLNGSPISIADLLNVLNEIRSNQESVGSVNVE